MNISPYARFLSSRHNLSPALPNERWLQKHSHGIASLSQLGMFFLVLFGYFYTVRPIYQKELLDEEIALKKMETMDLQSRLNTLVTDRDRLASEMQSTATESASLRSRLAEERVVMISDQKIFKASLESEKKNLEKQFQLTIVAERQRATRAEAIAKQFTEDLTRTRAFSALREQALLRCLDLDNNNVLNSDEGLSNCLKVTMSEAEATGAIAQADSELFGNWVVSETNAVSQRVSASAERSQRIGKLLFDEALLATIPCVSGQFDTDGVTSVIELRRAGRSEGVRCIGVDSMSSTLGGLVVRFSAYQQAIENVVSRTAERAAPGSIFVPSPPGSISVQ